MLARFPWGPHPLFSQSLLRPHPEKRARHLQQRAKWRSQQERRCAPLLLPRMVAAFASCPGVHIHLSFRSQGIRAGKGERRRPKEGGQQQRGRGDLAGHVGWVLRQDKEFLARILEPAAAPFRRLARRVSKALDYFFWLRFLEKEDAAQWTPPSWPSPSYSGILPLCFWKGKCHFAGRNAWNNSGLWIADPRLARFFQFLFYIRLDMIQIRICISLSMPLLKSDDDHRGRFRSPSSSCTRACTFTLSRKPSHVFFFVPHSPE